MTWTSKSPSYQGLRTPLRVIAGRCKMTVLRNYCLELLSWNYYLGIIFPFCLTDQPTDRPTHFREDGGDGGVGLETYLRGNLFMLGD